MLKATGHVDRIESSSDDGRKNRDRILQVEKLKVAERNTDGSLRKRSEQALRHRPRVIVAQPDKQNIRARYPGKDGLVGRTGLPVVTMSGHGSTLCQILSRPLGAALLVPVGDRQGAVASKDEMQVCLHDGFGGVAD
ncbi:hypothetical protein [Jannaschia aquimarina]|uniref:hypothetical protein n=1 Tax=Jannaschia aquimarina TaxID=935700 RepID=UPI001130AB98|nr:hypothetical protein [Jannaschia aquimarina]